MINKLEKILKIKFNNKSLLLNALTHKSANKISNNEKLEFLGDRVLSLIMAKKLYDLYPKENEGVLDKRFAKLVEKKTLATVAWSISIQNFIILGDKKKKISKKDEKILSDTCEAIIGAIYIDKGFVPAYNFVSRFLKSEISKSNVTILDAKTELQEHSLKKNKKLPNYRLVSFKGPRHNPVFKIGVLIEGSKEFFGVGKSKKEAEQNAASNLLNNMVTK